MATAKWFGPGALAVDSKQVDWVADTIVATLHTSAYTPNQDTHASSTDLTNEVAAGGGYATGGVTLTGKSVDYTGATNTTAFKAANVSWTPSGSGITARYLVLRDSTANKLLGYVDFTTDQTGTATFGVTWDATGVLVSVLA